MKLVFNPFTGKFDYVSSVTQYTDAMARLAISETILGIDYDNTTGIFSLTSEYVIPTTTEESNWNTAYGWGDHAGLYLTLDQTTAQTFTNLGGGTGLMKVTAGLLGLDTSTYLTSISGLDHNSLGNLVTGDVHTQYSLADGTRAFTGAVTMNENLYLAGSNKELRFYEGVNYVGFEAPALSANQIWVLPIADGNADEVIKTNGSGVLGWVDTRVCDSGSTLPGTPTAGRWFLHTPTGRKVLMQYDGSDWRPIENYGATIIYVDGVNGTDNLNYGGSSGAGAFATIQQAIDSLAGIISGNVVINVAAGNYTDNVVIQGKSFSGAFTIKITGAYNVDHSGLAVSASTEWISAGAGAGMTPGTVSVSAATFTASALMDKFIEIKTGKGAGQIRAIHANTTTAITIAGRWTPAALYSGHIPENVQPDVTSTFDVYTPTTYMDGAIFHVLDQAGIIIDKLVFRPNAGAFIRCIKAKASEFFVIQNCIFSSENMTGAFTDFSTVYTEKGSLTYTNNITNAKGTNTRFGYGLRIMQTKLNGEGIFNSKFYSSASSGTYGFDRSVIFIEGGSMKSDYGIEGVIVISSGTTNAACITVTGKSFMDIQRCIFNANDVATNAVKFDLQGVALLRWGCEVSNALGDGACIAEGSICWFIAGAFNTQINGNNGWGVNLLKQSYGKTVASAVAFSGNTSGTYTADASSITS